MNWPIPIFPFTTSSPSSDNVTLSFTRAWIHGLPRAPDLYGARLFHLFSPTVLRSSQPVFPYAFFQALLVPREELSKLVQKFSSASSAFKERKVRVLDLEINYIETFGNRHNAHPIFVLPGAFGSIEMDFKPIMHEFNKEKYKWIAWDPPGYGKSRPPTRPFLPNGYVCVYEYDVKYATELMNILGYQHYTLLAWSGGSITGVIMATNQPEKISGLITWGAGFFETEAIPFVTAMKEVGLAAIPESRRTQLTKMYGEELLLEMWNGVTEEMIKMAESKVYSKSGVIQDVLKNIQCPALVIHGLKDALIDVSHAKHFNSSLRNSRLHLVENGTHNLHLRETKEFVNCVQTFIDKNLSLSYDFTCLIIKMKRLISFSLLGYSKKLLGGPQFQFRNVKQQFSSASSSLAFTEKKVRVLDLDINYIETLGNSQNAHPIFILPGTFGSIEMDVKPILHEFNQEKYKWIAWDPPGYGGSRPPNRPFKPNSAETVYEYDVKYAEGLMNKLGIERYTLLAWSGGALTGIIMANKKPEKVSGLITWGAFGYAGRNTVPGVEVMRKLGLAAIPDWRRIPLTKMYGEELLLEMWNGWMDESIKMVKSDVFKEGGTFQDLIKNVQCPTLVIHGLKDALIVPSYANHLNSSFRNSRLLADPFS
ncbi:Valacyclovir hydrolase [Orchesella cincta]|uniref:Valacyclovir hydrolase n=1 Tax=Orchesella cincta TaxID=48709 RepID=A0A1D2N2P6_ORCCI|nr:Valacyclovir hydrolase [Orchesella cincta]